MSGSRLLYYMDLPSPPPLPANWLCGRNWKGCCINKFKKKWFEHVGLTHIWTFLPLWLCLLFFSSSFSCHPGEKSKLTSKWGMRWERERATLKNLSSSTTRRNAPRQTDSDSFWQREESQDSFYASSSYSSSSLLTSPPSPSQQPPALPVFRSYFVEAMERKEKGGGERQREEEGYWLTSFGLAKLDTSILEMSNCEKLHWRFLCFLGGHVHR